MASCLLSFMQIAVNRVLRGLSKCFSCVPSVPTHMRGFVVLISCNAFFPVVSHRQFLKSPNFDGWFRNRRKEMTQKLEALHLEALCEEVRRK